MVRLGDAWQETDQQTPYTACCQNDLTADQPTNRLAHESTMHTNKRRQWRTRADHIRLIRGLGVHENIPVSDTKLALGLRGFIISHLTADKLFPVNPRSIPGPPNMSLLLEVLSLKAYHWKQTRAHHWKLLLILDWKRAGLVCKYCNICSIGKRMKKLVHQIGS